MQRFREPVNGFTHLAGAVLSALGLIWLVAVAQNNTPKMMSLVIYGVSMILLYSASAIFHLIKTSDEKLLWLRRFDHAAIYVLIAGTYTPLFYNLLDGSFRWWLLVIVWIAALAGAAYKLFFLQDSGLLSLACYVIVGSIGIFGPANITSPAVRRDYPDCDRRYFLSDRCRCFRPGKAQLLPPFWLSRNLAFAGDGWELCSFHRDIALHRLIFSAKLYSNRLYTGLEPPHVEFCPGAKPRLSS